MRIDHCFQIREDIQTKGEFINDLIKKVVDAAYVDIEDVLKFVDWLDGELSTLVSFWQLIIGGPMTLSLMQPVYVFLLYKIDRILFHYEL
jgi:hypothetical protein